MGYVVGPGTEIDRDMTIGNNGDIYVGGHSTSAQIDGQSNSGARDALITKFNVDGTKAWTRLIGGAADDQVMGMATGADGSIIAVGTTWSTSFDSQTRTLQDTAGFITKLNPDGSTVWTRLLGGEIGYTEIADVKVDADGNTY
jgi:outer membrane protein assembly factor BamB